MNTTSVKVEVRGSAIEGHGVFALQEFRTGDLISQVNVRREITESEPLRTEDGERFDHCAYPDGRVLLYGVPDRYLNQSCDPNAYETYENGKPMIRARREIALHEEITLDYNINQAGGDSWPCHCGAARCRGETLGSFFKLPRETQLEYLPLLAEWFIERHGKQIRSCNRSRPNTPGTPPATESLPGAICGDGGSQQELHRQS